MGRYVLHDPWETIACSTFVRVFVYRYRFKHSHLSPYRDGAIALWRLCAVIGLQSIGARLYLHLVALFLGSLLILWFCGFHL